MKIVVRTLFMALVAFPYPVELSGPSRNGQPQWLHIEAASTPFSNSTWVPTYKGTYIPTGLYLENANHVLEPIPQFTPFAELNNFYIGRVHDGYVFPLFNRAHKIVVQEKFNDINQKVISAKTARELGIPGTVSEVQAAIRRGQVRRKQSAENEARLTAKDEAVEAAENEYRQAVENLRRQAAEMLRRQAAENEVSEVAENERRQAAENLRRQAGETQWKRVAELQPRQAAQNPFRQAAENQGRQDERQVNQKCCFWPFNTR